MMKQNLQVAAREALVNSVIHADFKEESAQYWLLKRQLHFLF
mgnify:CR=1 FL=1